MISPPSVRTRVPGGWNIILVARDNSKLFSQYNVDKSTSVEWMPISLVFDNPKKKNFISSPCLTRQLSAKPNSILEASRHLRLNTWLPELDQCTVTRAYIHL